MRLTHIPCRDTSQRIKCRPGKRERLASMASAWAIDAVRAWKIHYTYDDATKSPQTWLVSNVGFIYCEYLKRRTAGDVKYCPDYLPYTASEGCKILQAWLMERRNLQLMAVQVSKVELVSVRRDHEGTLRKFPFSAPELLESMRGKLYA